MKPDENTDNPDRKEQGAEDSRTRSINPTWFALALPYFVIGIVSINGEHQSVSLVWFALAMSFFTLGLTTGDADNDGVDRSDDNDPLP